ncbi:MAG: NosD domain-containing protein [Methanosarcina sp.]|jgi:hypothetical protein|uniref:NosD domain-containing protein n=1 Tax=Methanosarcina sp. TaxID=2213 RepID=UPI002D0F5E30|nr:NosD domain-containing protein [Methanosarcina sp.]MDM7919357.1 NosD domain-containing protein [Methanosarcina sp.]HOW15169.1 NosD domain-containing protein [Methanosarcina sp.]
MLRKLILTTLLITTLLIGTASAATLYVGSTAKYKTIQNAVNAANDGDTIKVASGTYNEYVSVSGKFVNIYGTSYPKVNGFNITQGGAVINGFSIQKNGVVFQGAGSNNTVRNNYFYNCGVDITGLTCSQNTIMNNQINNGTVALCETWDNVVQGNKITKAKIGLYMYEGATCTSITKNTFSYCDIGVKLPAVPAGMIGNTYIGNRINIQIADY